MEEKQRMPHRKIVAITMVKNEMDIIESFVRHTLGFADLLLVADHKSTDRTREILESLREEGLPVEIREVQEVGHVQAETMTQLAWEAADAFGADLILPIDADEFLLPTGDAPVRAVLQQLSPDEVRMLRLRQYAVDDFQAGSFLLDATLRCEPSLFPNPRIVVGGDLVRREHVPIAEGNHGIVRSDGVRTEIIRGELCEGAEYAHFPVRSVGQATSKYAVGWPNIVAKYACDTPSGGSYRQVFESIRDGGRPKLSEQATVPRDLHGCIPMPELRYSADTDPDVLANLMSAAEALAEELAETKAFASKPVVTTIIPYLRGDGRLAQMDNSEKPHNRHWRKMLLGMKS